MKLAVGTLVFMGFAKGESQEISASAVAKTLNEMTRAKG